MAAWAPDGRRLAIVNQQANATASIWIMDPNAPSPFVKLIDLGPGPRIRGCTWTRDGTALIGGMGEVYRARDTDLGRGVAIEVPEVLPAADRRWRAG